MQQQWTRIKDRLARLGCLDQMALRPGASQTDIETLEGHMGVRLPESFKQFLLIHDGQDGFGLVYGSQLLSLSGIRQQWNNWRSIDENAMNDDCAEFMGSEPQGFIKPLYSNRNWIPFSHDGGGNHVGMDFDPDAQGAVGQVIAFGRDEDLKRLLANSFEAFVEGWIDWLDRAVWNGQYLDVADSA
ncbi:MAG: SMI1/KNR4 family protein [Burkholderia sp.]